MRNLFIILIFVLLGQISFGQKYETILPRDNYSKEEIKNFALGDSPRSTAFRRELVSYIAFKTGKILSVEEIFSYTSIEEISPEKYQNSGWNGKEIIFFTGNTGTRFAGVFRKDGYVIPIFFSDCANLIRGLDYKTQQSDQNKQISDQPTHDYTKLVKVSENSSAWNFNGTMARPVNIGYYYTRGSYGGGYFKPSNSGCMRIKVETNSGQPQQGGGPKQYIGGHTR